MKFMIVYLIWPTTKFTFKLKKIMNFLLDFKIVHNKNRPEYKSSVDDEHNNNDTSPQMYISHEKFTLVSSMVHIVLFLTFDIKKYVSTYVRIYATHNLLFNSPA